MYEHELTKKGLDAFLKTGLRLSSQFYNLFLSGRIYFTKRISRMAR